jgi:hypothetical protein
MSRAIPDATACREALSRLPDLDLGELRQQWRALYKAEASPHLSRELLVRAVAHRMQEVALGGLRPQRQRQLRQIAQKLNQTGAANIPPRPELKPGTRLARKLCQHRDLAARICSCHTTVVAGRHNTGAVNIRCDRENRGSFTMWLDGSR